MWPKEGCAGVRHEGQDLQRASRPHPLPATEHSSRPGEKYAQRQHYASLV